MRRLAPLRAGFTLIELSIALFIAALLVAGTVQLARSAGQAYRLQQNLAALQEGARFGVHMMSREIAQAGYSPTPWSPGSRLQALDGSVDEASERGDVLTLRRWSNRNCYENANPARTSDGRPHFYLRVTRFAVSGSGRLAMTCRYGPDPDGLVTQINHLGLVENVRTLQALYAVDDSGNGNAQRWAVAGDWDATSRVLGVRLGLIVLSPDTFDVPAPDGPVTVADASVAVPGERLFRAVETSVAVQSHLSR